MGVAGRVRPWLRKRISEYYQERSVDQRRAAVASKARALSSETELSEVAADEPLVQEPSPTTPQQQKQAAEGPALVLKVLCDLGLQKYERNFEKAGYDDWPEVLTMDEEAFDLLVVRTRLAPNHADRLQTYVRRCVRARKLQLES